MSWLIVPVTVILLRGAVDVLILAGAESIAGEYLSARVRRALWIMCIFLMMLPQPNFSFHLFSIDLSSYRDHVLNVADILPRGIASLVGNFEFARAFRDFSLKLTGLSYHNYPYLLGIVLMIFPALVMLLCSYIRCRKQTENFSPVKDERVLNIWKKVSGKSSVTPVLLDSGETSHAPVLFGFFRQKLLLPMESFRKFSDEELELLLTHEYVHYSSGDGIINILTLCLWPFCWYNPFFLAARRRLRINCELACDAEVLKRFPERTAEYGRLLLEFAGTARPPEVAMAFREYAHELRSRIIYMTELPARRKSSLIVTFGLVLVLAAPFCLVSAISGDKAKNQYADVRKNETEISSQKKTSQKTTENEQVQDTVSSSESPRKTL